MRKFLITPQRKALTKSLTLQQKDRFMAVLPLSMNQLNYLKKILNLQNLRASKLLGRLVTK